MLVESLNVPYYHVYNAQLIKRCEHVLLKAPKDGINFETKEHWRIFGCSVSGLIWDDLIFWLPIRLGSTYIELGPTTTSARGCSISYGQNYNTHFTKCITVLINSMFSIYFPTSISSGYMLSLNEPSSKSTS